MSDFSRKTVRILARKGIRLVGLQARPGLSGDYDYLLDDNGTCRVLSFRDVMALAA